MSAVIASFPVHRAQLHRSKAGNDRGGALLAVAKEPRFAAVPPARIVPVLADEGVYLGSESNLDSRKIVGAEVHDADDADYAVHRVRRTALAESIATPQGEPVRPGDNGSTLKAITVPAMLQWLGIQPSSSRPRVSDDNAYAESLFRTARDRPECPAKGFASRDEARAGAAEWVRWYDIDHRHSGIRYVSPQQRHAGDDQAILAARHTLSVQARSAHPARWSRNTRNGSHIGAVILNPERDAVVQMAAGAQHTQPMAA